ncbi:flagellin [Ruminococcus sp.]|uniref:flagellin N-terminal helical domain-containing protein n=1 Tax=Ruminococcus sp. TaxID=41978 RepID=UPI0025836265|nr:flagellin [Ruminococcus sp.]MCR5021373.1 flagellar hook protein [Ruminococcus sp.]
MAMIVQHNLSSMNTNRMLGISTNSLSKSTEKLSSGYRINRAADDAAGLAISEKMRSQIRGLDQASSNAADGISMIQTAEGALNESHSILQRMRELAVQAANGTETDNDRSNLQDEIEQLQEELDRIASDTEFNTMPLLDGSLSAASSSVSSSGPKFGVYDTALQAFITSDVAGVKVDLANTAAQGGESAMWDSTGKILTINLVKDQTYTQQEIDNLIQYAKQEDSTAAGTPSEVKVNFYFSSVTATNAVCGATPAQTIAGARAKSAVTGFTPTLVNTSDYVGATAITLTALKYGTDYNITVNVKFDAAVNDEECELTTAATYLTSGVLDDPAAYTLHLCSGHEYSEDDLESIFAAGGLNIEVELSGPNPDEPNTLYVTQNTYQAIIKLQNGDGLGDDDAYLGQAKYGGVSGGKGITLQVGANEGQTMSFSIGDMSASALGVNASKVNVKTQLGASDGIKYIDEAIEKVSKQRSLLGAVQNRLEHTIANLDNTAENLQAAESTVRDVDMAEEMVQFSKNNILQQAGQSMLAQANQSTQGVLSLLQG